MKIGRPASDGAGGKNSKLCFILAWQQGKVA